MSKTKLKILYTLFHPHLNPNPVQCLLTEQQDHPSSLTNQKNDLSLIFSSYRYSHHFPYWDLAQLQFYNYLCNYVIMYHKSKNAVYSSSPLYSI